LGVYIPILYPSVTTPLLVSGVVCFSRETTTKRQRFAKNNRKHNLIVRSRESEAKVRELIIKDCARGIVLLKLQTDTKHRAASLREQSYWSRIVANILTSLLNIVRT